MRFDVVAGWTGALQFQLLSSGASVDVTGCTVTLRLTDPQSVATTMSATLVTATCGIVSVSPGSTDLVAGDSPYLARFKVVDGSAKVTYFPSGKHDEWTVHSA